MIRRRYQFVKTSRIAEPYLFVVRQEYTPGAAPGVDHMGRTALVAEALLWAGEHLPSDAYRYSEATDIFYFRDEAAALAFKLRWT